MEALIIEDEKLASMRLVKLLAAVAPDIEVVGMTKSVKESVEWLKNRERTPDVIFMDVELEDGTCFEIFRRSRISSNVVMVTAYNKYAINAFEVGCVDYLLKPVDQTMLHRSVERCRANRNVVDAERLLSALGRVLVSSDTPAVPAGYRKRFVVKTEEQFIRLKMRSLPITECLMETGWEERGLCCIVVNRQHPNGKITMGVFLVDNFCLGLKETHYFFEIPDEDYATRIGGDVAMKKVSYEEVHNFIYGAIAFAEEVGIKPAKSFELTQYILEEDTEDIPLIEYPYGKNGKYYLYADTLMELNTHLKHLQNVLGDEFGGFEVYSEQRKLWRLRKKLIECYMDAGIIPDWQTVYPDK